MLYSFGQETTSEIAGLVTDGKAGLGGATVTAIHGPTGTVYTTTSRKDGRYNLPNMRIGGPYTVTVSYVGFKEEKQENISLLLGEVFKSDFSLVAESKQLTEVVITASRQDKVFNNGHTGSQEVISRAQMDRLPTLSRSLQDFTRLDPSANGLSFGGRSSSYNNLTVDGANFNNAFGLSGTLGGQTNSQPISLDALEQIQVNVSPYDVRQGGFSGAGINSVTRSGTNQFKGSVYTYIKSSGLQGYNVDGYQLPHQTFDYNLWGAYLGGAFVPNKVFFFVSYEQERRKDPATTFVASTAGTPAGGNVSAANYDTLTALKNFLVKNFNYNPGFFQGYSYRTQSDKLTAKIDWNIGKRNTFTIKYNYLNSLRDIAASNSGSPSGGRQASSTGLPFSGAGYVIHNNFNIFIAELNTRFGNGISNKLQVGYTALRDFRESQGGSDFPLVDIMNGSNQSYTAFGYEPFTYHNVLNTDIYQLSDIFTLYKGTHEITFGTQDYYKKFKNGFAPNYEGVYRFKTLDDFYNSVNTGAATAIRYNLQYSALPDGSFPYAKIGVYELGFFVQDKWRVTNNFTLTYGLRVDAPIFENKFQDNPYADALTFRDGKHYSTGQKPNTNPLFSPRVGFNWDVKGDQQTQVRGGAGFFSGPPPFVWVSNQASNNGVQFGSFVKGPLGSPATAPVAFSADINHYRPTAGAANTSYNLVFTDPGFKYPQVLKANIAIDQKLPWGIIGTLEFMYSKDINAVNFENVNLPDTGITPFKGADPRWRYSANQINRGQGGATQSNPIITNAILMKNYSKGYAYTATLQLQKSFRNVYLNVAYTFSQSQTLNDGGSIAQSNWNGRPTIGDPNSPELGYANFYQPHRIIASAFYRKEYAKFFATSAGLIYEAAPAGVGSYTYNGDPMNTNTGTSNFMLMYIPNNSSEITLVPVGNNPAKDPRTAAQIWSQLDAFINSDHYLSQHRGQFAQRNAAVLPWFSRMDFNITQEIFYYTGRTNKTKHTLKVSFDILNVGNMISNKWGVYKTFTQLSPLNFEGMANGTPTYSFPFQVSSSQTPYTNAYKDDTGNPLSHWQGQIGIRYLFN
ncbi:cell envelope biogenesis protein OmpA [Puia dinghuensis]|uniref:Cell envelope biogenesis protein OmpA n=2 Tax=Puia dinghuensis TaxID=1792502 RepID=A0A8J2UA14_9BACT|nr:cell envelope biogenesis protein OmpA [Puia dinghuensis]